MKRREFLQFLTISPILYSSISLNKEDIIYHEIVDWAEKNCKIYDLNKGVYETVKLLDYQKENLTKWQYNNYNNLLSLRQSGSTTMLMIDAVYQSIKNPNKKSIIICNDMWEVEQILNNIIISFDMVDHYSRENNIIKFKNNSSIALLTINTEKLKGFTSDNIYISLTYCIGKDRMTDLFLALLPLSVNRNCRITVIRSIEDKEKIILNKDEKQIQKHYSNIDEMFKDLI